jgi:hypothetical protein
MCVCVHRWAVDAKKKNGLCVGLHLYVVQALFPIFFFSLCEKYIKPLRA